jgi:small GTP-binding protein
MNKNNINNNNDFVYITEDTNIKNTPYLFIFKVILIGDSNCGKTSMINKYVNNEFNNNYICTIGVDFMMKNLVVNSEVIKIQIWDTAGMEKFKQITTSYYRGAQAALICFDLTCRNSFLSLSKWVDDFNRFSNSLFKKSIYIIGLKNDLIQEREVDKNEIMDYVKINNYKYYECSSKTGENIKECFYDVCSSLYNFYKDDENEKIKESICIKRHSSINIDDKYLNILKKENSKNCFC